MLINHIYGQRTHARNNEELEEVAMFQRIREWLSLKNYQYQVTTGIYMLEPWERTIFSILFGIDYSKAIYICVQL